MRKLGWALVAMAALGGAGSAAMLGSPPASAFSGEVFEMTGTARFLHFHGPTQPGKKAFVNNANGSIIAAAIRNDDPRPGHNAAGFLETSSGGKSYLRYVSETRWEMSLDPTFTTDVMTMDGFVDGTGAFMFHGIHAKSGTTFIASGKVKFKKGTLTPTAINGKIQGVSVLTQHFATGTLKSVGKAK